MVPAGACGPTRGRRAASSAAPAAPLRIRRRRKRPIRGTTPKELPAAAERQSDVDDVRIVPLNALRERLQLAGALLEAQRRALGAGDRDAGGLLAQDLAGRLRGARVAADEIEGGVAPPGLLGQRPDEVRARHPFGERRVLDPACPDERHAVGDDQVRVVEVLAHLLRALVEAQMVEVRGDHPAALAAGDPLAHRLDDLLLGRGVDGHVHDLYAAVAVRHQSPLRPRTNWTVRRRIFTSAQSDQLAT